MLLPKTIETLQSTHQEVIQDTILDFLRADGVSVSLLDLVFGRNFIYAIINSGVLMPVFLHEGRISYNQSQNEGLPKLHCCNCSIIKNDFSPESKAKTLQNRHYLASRPKHNAFSFSIRRGLSEAGLYNDYPLEICSACSEIIESMRKKQKNAHSLETFIFDKHFITLLENDSNMRQKELIDLQIAGVTCCKCGKVVSEDSQIWLQIQDDILRISCC